MANNTSASDTRTLLDISHDASESEETNHDKTDVSIPTTGESSGSANNEVKDVSEEIENDSDKNRTMEENHVVDNHVGNTKDNAIDDVDNETHGADEAPDEHVALISQVKVEDVECEDEDQTDMYAELDDMTKRYKLNYICW